MKHPFVIVLATIAIFVGTATYAPAGVATSTGSTQSAGQTHLQRFKAAIAQLNLTASQKQQIKQIWSNAKAKLSTGSAGKEGHPLIAAEQEIVSILTQAQRTQLRELMKASRK